MSELSRLLLLSDWVERGLTFARMLFGRLLSWFELVAAFLCWPGYRSLWTCLSNGEAASYDVLRLPSGLDFLLQLVDFGENGALLNDSLRHGQGSYILL